MPAIPGVIFVGLPFRPTITMLLAFMLYCLILPGLAIAFAFVFREGAAKAAGRRTELIDTVSGIGGLLLAALLAWAYWGALTAAVLFLANVCFYLLMASLIVIAAVVVLSLVAG